MSAPHATQESRPLVTIITPSLNQGAFIEETIQSVLQQDYEPIEYLIYDGGSTDGTQEILARYENRARIFIGSDGGQAEAINRGLREARGEVVAWLNSDDTYEPGAVSAAVDYLGAHPRCAMVYGDGWHIDSAGRTIGPYPTAPAAELQIFCVVCQPAAFMRREAVEAVGFLDPSLEFCLDYDLWLRLAARYDLDHVPRFFARSRLHPDSKSVSQQLPFMREIVHMTHRRIGRAPLVYLYGYANMWLLSHRGCERLPNPLRRLVTTVLTGCLALRYHRRLDRAELRHAIARAVEVSRRQMPA
jgi:glycosyltransferase involved in cell wall biosynthesis